jgi:hypothetical protein
MCGDPLEGAKAMKRRTARYGLRLLVLGAATALCLAVTSPAQAAEVWLDEREVDGQMEAVVKHVAAPGETNAVTVMRSTVLPFAGASTAQPPWLDPTEYWSSPGAVWIARQLSQVNPSWHIRAAGLDEFARDWCLASNPDELAFAVNRLILYTTPGADLRTLPALGQMLRLIEQSCVYQGGDPAIVNYWIHITANYMMTVVRNNTRSQIQAGRVAWSHPPPAVPPKAKKSMSSQVTAGACGAAVDIGSNLLVGKFTKLAGLRTMGIFGLAKLGCNALVTKIWREIF